MLTKDNKVTAYFSHAIRGKKGKAATEKDMKKNCDAAMEAVEWLRSNIPELELYVPAEHEDFVLICYEDKYLTEEQILEVDCKILQQRDILIVNVVDEWLGGGIAVEIADAKRTGKLIFYLTTYDIANLAALRVIVKDYLRSKG